VKSHVHLGQRVKPHFIPLSRNETSGTPLFHNDLPHTHFLSYIVGIKYGIVFF
jgi:hypothetical protein